MVQLALDLGLVEEPPRTVVSRANEAAYALCQAHPDWPHPIALVSGGPGTGKSHLLQAFADRTGATIVGGAMLHAHDPLTLAQGAVAVDDVDRAEERAIFHLINAVRASGTSALFTARQRPLVTLPDLHSRFQAMMEVRLDAPDDALLKRVMMERFIQRQLPAEPKVIAHLMGRMERTLHDAVALVDEMDRLGLAEGKGPTRPLATKVLAADALRRCA